MVVPEALEELMPEGFDVEVLPVRIKRFATHVNAEPGGEDPGENKCCGNDPHFP
jgi:hypothetical protein